MTRQIGAGGLALLHEFEQGPNGFYASEPYDAHDGKRTIGWGHVITGHEPFDCSRTITVEQADALLRLDTEAASEEVEMYVTVPLTDNQSDALICLCFNIGARAFADSTLVKVLNAGNMDGVPEQIARWNHIAGVISSGLVRRRAAEIALWNTAKIPKNM